MKKLFIFMMPLLLTGCLGTPRVGSCYLDKNSHGLIKIKAVGEYSFLADKFEFINGDPVEEIALIKDFDDNYDIMDCPETFKLK